jgi:hypothetical protein
VRRSPTGRVFCAVASALTLWASVGAAAAQPADEASPEQMLKDFIHYVLIARYDAADLVGQQLLTMELPPQAFTDLLDTSGEYSRFKSAIGEAMRADAGGDLESTAAALERLYESGRLERARSPEEIGRNIGLLTGQLQGRYLATQRLLTAGEYAGPQLVEALLDSQSPELQAIVQQILIEMGSQSVMPLCVSLMNVTGPQQELVANVLGLKGYRTALPYLADVAESTSVAPVRQACERAIERLGGAGGASVAQLYLQLGEAYYAERPEVTSFAGEDYQLLWSYLAGAPGTSLIMTPILTEVYHEAMAMRLAEATLREDAQSIDAAALWVASNIKRDVEQPDDYDNPVYGADRREPTYFAVAAGMAVDHRVLARALDTRNTPLARRTIAAIEEIAGGSQLWSGTTDRRPLVEALGYPNRRVQYEAALAFGAAQPSSPFEGADRVVPLLASAVRDASAQYAMVLTQDVEQYQALRRVLEAAGYQVLPRAASLDDLRQEIADIAGIDVIVAALPRDAALEMIEQARYSAKLAATPVLALLDAQDAATTAPRFERESMVMVRRAGITEEAIANAVSQLVGDASGGTIGDDEARSYSERAITVLRDLAVSGNEVLHVQDATGPLIGALSSASGGRRMAIAEVLAFIPDPRAQQALVDTALASSGGEQAALLAHVADSAKRFGNQLDERQVARVVTVATSDAPEESLAAAALLGALGVPNSDFLPQLLGE